MSILPDRVAPTFGRTAFAISSRIPRPIVGAAQPPEAKRVSLRRKRTDNRPKKHLQVGPLSRPKVGATLAGCPLVGQLCQSRRNRLADADQCVVVILAKQPTHVLGNQVVFKPETLTNDLLHSGRRCFVNRIVR